jgi:hypothetical protein
MALKNTRVDCIKMDWDQREPGGLFDGKLTTQKEWEDGVTTTLDALYFSSPCETSKAVIDALKSACGAKFNVTIVPFTLKSWQTAQGRLPTVGVNAGAVADNKAAATVRGKLSDELPDTVVTEIRDAPAGEQREKVRAKYQGTAAGSGSHLYFTAQFFAKSAPTAGLDAADEALLHELVHSLRQASGQEEPDRLQPRPWLTQNSDLKQNYDTLEEFASIVFTNIYRSEKGRPKLRAQHIAEPDGSDAPLPWPLTKPRNFLTFWKPQIVRLAAEQPTLVQRVARITCPFNPLSELQKGPGP